jgi:DNA-binding transcriptional regulator YiaG
VAKGGRVDKVRVRHATESQIQTWRSREGYGDFEIAPRVRAVPKVDARKIRERIGLTQEEFANRYRLPLRTVQEWEQGRKQPSEPARVLLFAISRDPKALERALHR